MTTRVLALLLGTAPSGGSLTVVSHTSQTHLLAAEISFELTESQEVSQRKLYLRRMLTPKASWRVQSAQRQGLEDTLMNSQLLGCWHSNQIPAVAPGLNLLK